MVSNRWILAGVVLAQLMGSSPWFSGSAAMPSLINEWGLAPTDAGLVLSAVQLGFILGTLVFALTNLSDIFPASKVFLICAFLGGAMNLLFAYTASDLSLALVYRFITGVAMAGVYPVGMKVVVSWSPKGVGNALGWLVGALVLGSASPYLIRAVGHELPWQTAMAFGALPTFAAGLLVAWIGDGPHLKPAPAVNFSMIFRVFSIGGYRRAALGYFGHMWELYAFYALTPLMVVAALKALNLETGFQVSLWAFLIMGAGAAGCVGGGLLSRFTGSSPVAAVSLAISGVLCVLAPFLLGFSPVLFLGALVVWGFFVVSDSPQFSALSAEACPPEYVGTALTIQNSIGFALTIFSIEWVIRLWDTWGVEVTWLLAPGPLLGLILLQWPPGYKKSIAKT